MHAGLAQSFEIDRLQVPLPPTWKVRPADRGTGKTLTPPDSQVLIVALPGDPIEGDLQQFLESFLAEVEAEMSPLGGTPAESFQTSGGLQGISQARFSKSAEGQELYSLVFVVQVENQAQFFYLAAHSEEQFKKVALPLAKAVKEARLVGEVALPTTPTASVDFDLEWSRRLDLGIPFVVARAKEAESLLAFLPNSEPAKQAPVWRIGKSVPRPEPMDFTLQAALRALQSKPEGLMEAWAPEQVTAMEMDAQANLALGINGPGGTAFVSRRAENQEIEVIATPGFVAEVAAQLGDNCTVHVRLAPLGEAWLLVYDESQASTDLDSSLRLYRLQRMGEDNWRALRVVLQVEERWGSQAPSQFDFAKFAADWNGGLVFATADALWRMDPQGRLSPLGKLDPSLVGRMGPEPVIQRNGDIWFWSKSSPTETDYSELLRLRLRQGRLETARIEASTLSGIFAVGQPLSGELLRLDYSHGGLLGLDSKHGILFSILPKI